MTGFYDTQGAFKRIYDTIPTRFTLEDGVHKGTLNWNFDASRSSSIYQANATVRPDSISVLVLLRL